MRPGIAPVAAAGPPFLDDRTRIADAVRRKDWNNAPLGRPETWPTSLKTALNIIFGSTSPKILIWGPDYTTFYNDAYLPFLDPAVEGEVGQPYAVLHQDWPTARAYIEAAMSRPSRVIPHEVNRVRHDPGEEAIPFTRSFSPVYDESDSIAGAIGELYETTGPVQLQNALEAENKRFRELFRQAPIFLALGSGREFRFEYVNDLFQEMSGNRNLIGKTITEAFPDLDDIGSLRKMEEVFDTGRGLGARDVLVEMTNPADGQKLKVYIDIFYQPIVQDGQVTGLVLVGSDVTEQHVAAEDAQRLRNQLHHSSRINAMGTMAATLAHELNQPLAAAVNYLSGSQRLLGRVEVENKKQIMEALRRAQEQISYSGEIIRRARSLVTSNHYRRTAVSLGELVAQAVQLVEATEGGSDIRIECSLDADATLLLVDPIQTEQILVNLIRNACQAMADCKTRELHISSRKIDGPFAEIRVQDTGPGLPRDSNVLFFPPSASANGLGVGLSISRTIIEAHGGSISARNAPEGGALLVFTLPLAPPEDQAGHVAETGRALTATH